MRVVATKLRAGRKVNRMHFYKTSYVRGTFPVQAVALSLAVLLAANCGFPRKKYENPIAKDTLQPDKQLFDRAVNDIEHGRFEVARLTLNTLINTYDSSEYMAKAKLAIADSWYREGGAHGLAQAEAEYKDFELFYPTMEESAEAQWRICQIHYKQMEKVDRDNTQAQRAEDECRQMITAYPNSHYTAQATQMLRNVQEVLAAKEYLAGEFYHGKGAFPAAENRFAYVAQQYPLYSKADDALWEEADSFKRMGDRFDEQQTAALSRIVKEYPLSDHVDEAKKRLETLKQPVPAADPVAYERMKYDQEALKKPGILHRSLNIMERGPDPYTAAKSGTPAMASIKPPTPVSVPAIANADANPGGPVAGVGSNEVSATAVSNTHELDTQPNQLAGGAGKEGAAATSGTAGGTTEGGAPAGAPSTGASPTATAASDPRASIKGPLPTNYQETDKQRKKRLKAMEKAAKKRQQQQPAVEVTAPAPGDKTPVPTSTTAPSTGTETPPKQ